MRKLARASVIVAAVSVVSLLFASMSPVASATSAASATGATSDARHRTVGTVTLSPCTVLPHAWCGSVQRAWDPSGRVHGTVSRRLRLPAGE